MTKSHKVTFAAVAAITAALSLAIVPALTTQAFAQDFSQGRGHTQTCDKANTDEIEEGPCPGQSHKSDNKFEATYAGKSHVQKAGE
jgi:hypothetical protein